MQGLWSEGLNPAQHEAVTAGDGPLLVVAGAGTGKTRTLACRVAYLIEQGIPAERILLLTFTRRAAAEMVRRAGHMAGRDVTGAVWGGTFHATANRLLRIYGRSLGLSDGFTVMDQSDAADLIHLIRGELGVARGDRRFPKKHTLLAIYSRMVNAGERLEETLLTCFPWCRADVEAIKPIFESYMTRKRDQDLLDFDDLLLFWSALCATPNVGRTVADRFDHILVDEYQDTNALQAEILRGMRRSCMNITVVGDDAQSIYSFRAATIRNILDFPEQFPDTRTVTLEQNYRSITPILAASNAVMEEAGERYTKELWSHRHSEQKPELVTCTDENEQCDAVCRNILEHLEQGAALMHQAVLFRAGHHSAQLEIELARRNIPFRKYGGLKFVEIAHIKDMLSLLRILENPYDELAWYRVCQLLEGIGPRTSHRMMHELGVRFSRTATEDDAESGSTSPLDCLAMKPPKVPPAAREPFAKLREVLIECSGLIVEPSENDADAPRVSRGTVPSLTVQLERIRQFYEPIFERLFDNAAIRLHDLDQLTQIASTYRSRKRFITDLTLDPPETASDLAQPPYLEEDYLILSTMHSAKGCEWTVVHILHAADGMIPSDMAVKDQAGVDEERRLFYVAMTRAKDRLYVYFPLRYYHRRHVLGDAHGYAQLTRFIPDSVRPLFDVRSANSEVDSDESIVDADGKSDPYERVRRLWND